MKIRNWIILWIILLPLAVNAQLISVKSEFSRDSIAIGEQLLYKFIVETVDSVKIDFPLFYDTLSNQLEVIELTGVDTLVSEGKVKTEANYLITSFEKGEITLGPKAVVFSAGALTDTAYSLPVALAVTAPVVDTTQAIKPIKPPVNTPLSFAEILPWTLIGLGSVAVVLLIALLLRRYLRRRNDPEAFNLKPKEPAHIIALRELDRLKEEKVLENEDAKSYYSRLTEIIRVYISDLYALHAMESTSDEILEHFKLVHHDEVELYEKLADLLNLADLVKFAKEDPLRKEKEEDLQEAYTFVHQTQALMNAQVADEPAKDENENNNEVESVAQESLN